MLLSQELMEGDCNGSAFHDDKFLLKNGHPKELFLSSDANAVVEHTKRVLVIEDGEVVHLKVLDFPLFSIFILCISVYLVYKFLHSPFGLGHCL